MSTDVAPSDTAGAVTVTLIRHAQTEYNQQRRVQGSLDTPLSDLGHHQARQLVGALQARQFSAVYCSDLQRTRQTIAPYLAATNRAALYRADLRERRFGWFEGKTVAEVRASHPDRAERLASRDPTYDGHGGESLVNFYQRAVTALQTIAAGHQPAESVLVVTHGGVLDCVQRWARDLALSSARDFDILNTSVNRVRIRAGNCEIVSWADVSHL